MYIANKQKMLFYKNVNVKLVPHTCRRYTLYNRLQTAQLDCTISRLAEQSGDLD